MTKTRTEILLVDDDDTFRSTMASWLSDEGYDVTSCRGVEECLKAAGEGDFSVALVDLVLGGQDGLSLLAQLKSCNPLMEQVVLTGAGTIETTVTAMRSGAYDYVVKPADPAKLRAVISKAKEKSKLARHAQLLEVQVRRLSREVSMQHGGAQMVGECPAMKAVREKIAVAGPSRSTVLITGPSGTGKELAARAIHAGTSDGLSPFVPVNCAALHRDRIDSELFGVHRRAGKEDLEVEEPGLFLAAEGGTLFLDEITEMSMDVQAKVLRVLQEKAFRPLGLSHEIPVDFRVIATTNRDPAQAVAEGKLREDLYYRLSVVPIALPPLAQRNGDISLLASHFISMFNGHHHRKLDGVDEEVAASFEVHDWPGNVRELRNVIEAAFHFSKGDRISLCDLPPRLAAAEKKAAPAAAPAAPLEFDGVVSLKDAERQAIAHALRQLNGNKSLVAKALGISRKQLYVKLAVLGLGGDKAEE